MLYDYLNLDVLRCLLSLILTANVHERFFCKKSECAALPALPAQYSLGWRRKNCCLKSDLAICPKYLWFLIIKKKIESTGYL